MEKFKTRQPIRGKQKDEKIREIREHLEEYTKDDWTWFSHDLDFDINELREFQDYIDWNCYYIYSSNNRKANINNDQLFEFKEKDKEWLMIFETRKLDEPTIRRWMWDFVKEVYRGWKWLKMMQKLSLEFLEEYKEPIQKAMNDK